MAVGVSLRFLAEILLVVSFSIFPFYKRKSLSFFYSIHDILNEDPTKPRLLVLAQKILELKMGL